MRQQQQRARASSYDVEFCKPSQKNRKRYKRVAHSGFTADQWASEIEIENDVFCRFDDVLKSIDRGTFSDRYA